VALEVAVHLAARELRVDAAAHDLDDVIERQSHAYSELDHEPLFERRHRRRDAVRTMRAVAYVLAATPARDRTLAHAEFPGEVGDRSLARLDISADFRRGRRVGVQLQVHARRSLRKAMPLATPIPSRQSPGTKHEGRDDAISLTSSSMRRAWRDASGIQRQEGRRLDIV
jgi:hypothetical protein